MHHKTMWVISIAIGNHIVLASERFYQTIVQMLVNTLWLIGGQPAITEKVPCLVSLQVMHSHLVQVPGWSEQTQLSSSIITFLTFFRWFQHGFAILGKLWKDITGLCSQ